MSKERDWIDYAQLGLSAVQTAKISQVADEMGRVASETGRLREVAESQARAVRDIHEAQERKARRLQQMFQVIWMAEQLLNRLESGPQGETTPQRKYIYTYEIEAFLKKADLIPPTALEDMDDMDRVGKLVSRVDNFRETLARAMSETERKEADLCWQYMGEDNDLSNMLEKRAALEERRPTLERNVAALKSEMVAS